MFKKLLVYPILFIITLLISLGYGFLIGGEFPRLLFGALIVCDFLVLAFIGRRNTAKRPLVKAFTMLLSAVLIVCLVFFLYYVINDIAGTEVDSYEATVTQYITYRGTTTLYFDDPSGDEQYVEIPDPNAFTPVIADDESIDYTGKTIRITVYSGLFGIEYHSLTEQKISPMLRYRGYFYSGSFAFESRVR